MGSGSPQVVGLRKSRLITKSILCLLGVLAGGWPEALTILTTRDPADRSFKVIAAGASSHRARELRRQGASNRPANQDTEAFWKLKAEEGFSFASGAWLDLGFVQAQTQTRILPMRTIRIGLNPTRFSESGEVLAEFDTSTAQRHSRIVLTATGPFILLQSTCEEGSIPIAFGEAGEAFAFTATFGGIAVEFPSGITVSLITNSICIAPVASDVLLAVMSIRRRNLNRAGNPFEPPYYRGVLEIQRATGLGESGLRLINVLDLEEYLQGVITNEMPASFHPEALRAQAVAARTYALANRGRFASRGFDLDDSTLSQVYRGVLSEHPNGTAAIQSTRGLVVVRDGELIPTFYSSSMGGHTEGIEWIFNAPADQLPGSNAHPALRAVHDGDFPVPVDLLSDEGALVFYSRSWDHFDSPQRSGNSRYRWVVTRSVEFIAERLASTRGLWLGTILDVIATLRSPSGRIAQLQIVGERGTVTLQGWRTLRDFFQLLNSPSAIVPRRDATGRVTGFDLYGGGWGHNVGMSQYGAHGRGRSGQTFREILAAYYMGAEVVSIEVEASEKPNWVIWRERR